jgi:hypothetical protein
MAKAGDEYQEIVGAVAKALDRGASVKVGQWVEGPDGRRDLDVEVRGTIKGSPYFVQIECKDWADPVGIGVVDALDSKRRDLGANRAIIFSNSGFTAPALLKAARIGIEMASALKAGDQRIQVVIERLLVAKRLSIDSMRAVLHPAPGQPPEFEDGWNADHLLCDNLPVMNWISELSRRLIQEHEDAKKLTFRCTFRPHAGWTYDRRPISVAAIELFFQCSKQWVGQTVQEDVTLGSYDHLRRSVAVPDKQGYFMGPIDRDGWVDVDSGWEEKNLESNSFKLYLTLLNHIPPIQGAPAPRIDEMILEKEISVD